jgi:hypothetical protein
MQVVMPAKKGIFNSVSLLTCCTICAQQLLVAHLQYIQDSNGPHDFIASLSIVKEQRMVVQSSATIASGHIKSRHDLRPNSENCIPPGSVA